MSNIQSDITITITSVSTTVSAINDILNIDEALFDKFDPDVVKIDIPSKGNWIIEPIPPIHDIPYGVDGVTFKITPNLINYNYAQLPMGIKIGDLSESSSLSCTYFIQKDSNDINCAYLTFYGNVSEADAGTAKLVFSPTALNVSLQGINNAQAELESYEGFVSGAAEFSTSPSMSLSGSTLYPAAGPDEPVPTNSSYPITYERDGLTKCSVSSAFIVGTTSDDVRNIRKDAYTIVNSPVGSFWAIKDGAIASDGGEFFEGLPNGCMVRIFNNYSSTPSES